MWKRRIYFLFRESPIFLWVLSLIFGQTVYYLTYSYSFLLQAFLLVLCFPIFTLKTSILKRGIFISIFLGLVVAWFHTIRIKGQIEILEQLETNEINVVYLGRVVSIPRRKKAHTVSVDLNVFGTLTQKITSTKFKTSFKLRCKSSVTPWSNSSLINEGNVIAFKANIKVFPENPKSIFTYESYLLRRGIIGTCNINFLDNIKIHKSFRTSFREYIAFKLKGLTNKREVLGLVLSLTLGFRDQISLHLEEVFKRVGIPHILVLSGYQVTTIFFVIKFTLCFLFRKFSLLLRFFNIPVLINLIALIIVFLVVYTSGFERSGVRALFGVSFYTIASIWGVSLSIFHIIALCLGGISLVYPGSIFEVGVLLTFFALLGISIGRRENAYKKLTKYRRIIRRFYELSSVSFWCYTVLLPINILFFGKISILSLFFNIIISPVLCLVGVCIGGVGIFLNIVGLDNSGVVLRFAVEGLAIIIDFIESVSKFSWVFVEINGMHAITLAMFCIFVVILRCLYLLNKFFRKYGIEYF